MTLLDEFMPRYHFREIHSVAIHAPPARITALEVPFFRNFRLLPRRLVVKAGGLLSTPSPIFEHALKSGFVLLGESPDQEFVLGRIARFWMLRGGSSPRIGNASAFLGFDRPGYAKATISFRISRENEASRLTTETRVDGTDSAARRRFARYWLLIHPGSALLRKAWLDTIRREAEDSLS